MSQRDDHLIRPIAAFIGARLQHPYPEVNGQGNPWVSTIKVAQYKEKFYGVRIYCELADADLIKEYWAWLKKREVRKDAGEQIFSCLHRNVIDLVRNNAEPPDDFVRRCMVHDSIHYRKCYREMVALQPHLDSKICSQADHVELLWPQHQEVCDYLDRRQAKDPEHLTHLYSKYYVDDSGDKLERLKAFLKVVYEPTTKDCLELRD